MEFLLFPLVAIMAATFGIYKLAELVFHIYLSCRLLVLLVAFAWLISLVLPELFFHSAGFLGSVGVSLISAAGFAWLATAYDTRTQASQPIPSISAAQIAESDSGWTVQNDAVFLANHVRNETTNDNKEVMSPTMKTGPLHQVLPALTLVKVDALPEQTDLAPQISAEEAFINQDRMLKQEGEPEIDGPTEDLVIADSAQPASDSLEDLLEFAFEQRSQHQEARALNTFRLIKHLYSESDALPMVVAEIVSTLQSQGDYAEAAAELTKILQLPAIRERAQLTHIFEQKLMELHSGSGNRSG